MKEEQKEIAFRSWVATISDEFRAKYDQNLLDYVDFEFTGSSVIGRFHKPRLGRCAANIALEYRLVLRDAGLGLELFVGDDVLISMPVGYKTKAEVLQEYLPNGFQVEVFGSDLKIIAPNCEAAHQLWRDIGSIAQSRLIGYWAYLSIECGGESIIEAEPIAPLLKKFGSGR